MGMPFSKLSSHPSGTMEFKPLSRRVLERFCMNCMLHSRQNHPSPENIQHSLSTQSCASSLLSNHSPFSTQSSATWAWHITEYWLSFSINNAVFFFNLIKSNNYSYYRYDSLSKSTQVKIQIRIGRTQDL